MEDRWEDGGLLVTCPSCGALLHEVKKEAIDDMVRKVMADSLANIQDALDEKK